MFTLTHEQSQLFDHGYRKAYWPLREKTHSFMPYPMELHISNDRAPASGEGQLGCSAQRNGVGQSSNECLEDSSVN